MQTLDGAVVQFNLPGNYILLETELVKIQATIDYRTLTVDNRPVIVSVFTRFALSSLLDSGKAEVELVQSDLLNFVKVSFNSEDKAIESKVEGKARLIILMLKFFNIKYL